ncbi:hypothetical protein [Neptuniibacter sp. QD37_11]|uniref:hypothetical protein n=1 Tax=Neptuniibacter sp. QD37_11 TaxID=3398209 RepID=UPI0039F4C2CE
MNRNIIAAKLVNDHPEACQLLVDLIQAIDAEKKPLADLHDDFEGLSLNDLTSTVDGTLADLSVSDATSVEFDHALRVLHGVFVDLEAQGLDFVRGPVFVYAAELGMTGEKVVYREYDSKDLCDAFELGVDVGVANFGEDLSDEELSPPDSYTSEQIVEFNEAFALADGMSRADQAYNADDIASIKHRSETDEEAAM